MKKTNKEKALEWLKTGKPLTSWDAFEHHHNTRLSATIFLLKQDGYDVRGRNVVGKNGKTYYEYRLYENEC